MKDAVRWGILATGGIANRFAKALAHVPNAQLRAVASRGIDAAQAFASAHGVPKAYGSYLELAQDRDIDVVYIATPHVFHFENSMMCLEHGKAVLCEKPFAMDYQQVSQMIGLARNRRLFLMEALWTRFLPSIINVLAIIEGGAIGRIVQVKSDFGIRPPFDPQGRLYNRALGGGSLLDIGIYPVFIALLLLGEPEHIQATAHIGPTGVDESLSVLFGYAQGQQAVLHSTLLAATAMETDIYGTQGWIRIHRHWHTPAPVTLTLYDGTVQHFPFEPICNGYEYEAMEVTQCLLEGKTESSIMTHEFSLQLIGLLDRVRAIGGITYDL